MTLKWLQHRSWDGVFRKRVPGVRSGNRKSSATDGSQSDWRNDKMVSSGRTQSSSTRDINSRGERPQIPQTCIWPSWCHCHSLSLASIKSRLVLPFWYRLTWLVQDKGPLNGCVLWCLSLSRSGMTLLSGDRTATWHVKTCCYYDCQRFSYKASARRKLRKNHYTSLPPKQPLKCRYCWCMFQTITK